MQRLELGPVSAETQPRTSHPKVNLAEPRRCQGLAAAGGGREGGRQAAGGGGKNLFFPCL